MQVTSIGYSLKCLNCKNNVFIFEYIYEHNCERDESRIYGRCRCRICKKNMTFGQFLNNFSGSERLVRYSCDDCGHDFSLYADGVEVSELQESIECPFCCN